jgi:O-antigen/teichoic acid export membrane protein
MVVYFLLSSVATIFTYVVNATGKIKLQRNLYLFIALINIPISVFFIKLGFGSKGVILSSSLCLIILLIPIYFQAKSILKE